MIYLSPPWTGRVERAAVARALDSGYVAPCGPSVDAFERAVAALAGRRHAVAVSSGTAAIDLAMAEWGVDASWTVIAPTLTFIATVGPAWHRGARPVFVDCDVTGLMDLSLLERALVERAKKSRTMVIGVDLYGRCSDYAALERICRRHGAVLVCDSAEAVGACDPSGRPAGSAGRAAVFSFNGNKIVTTSGGGALVTDDAALARRAKKRAQQARENRPWYEHREVGYDYRLSNVSAAIGLAQLEKLSTILARRAANAARYRRSFEGCLDFLPSVAGESHWLTVALARNGRERSGILKHLAEKGIEARPVWKPMHLQPVFRGLPVYGGKVSEDLFRRGLCLPSGTGLTARDFAVIQSALASFRWSISFSAPKSVPTNHRSGGSRTTPARFER